jgi:cytidylate kinase
MIIAIDGPSASGKSTTAKGVSQRLGFTHLDTGAMYRAVTFGVNTSSISLNNKNRMNDFLNSIDIHFDKKNEIWLNGKNVSSAIRTVDISSKVSLISAKPEIRKKMVEIQRSIAGNHDCVLEGRDIGTVVFPNAKFKFYIVADIMVRAQRRLEQINRNEKKITLNKMIANIENRDKLDSSRAHSPLKRAEDAIVIDTSHLTIDEQINKIVEIVNQ